MSKELEAIDIQENFINCFKELLTKTNHNIIQVNITKNMAQEIVNLYEQYKKSKTSEAINYLDQFLNEMTSCLENPKGYAKGYEKEIFYKYKHTLENTIKARLLKAQEIEKILEITKKHLTFKDSGIEEYTDILTNKKVKKHYIKIESKDTGATIHIHLDTQKEFDTLIQI